MTKCGAAAFSLKLKVTVDLCGAVGRGLDIDVQTFQLVGVIAAMILLLLPGIVNLVGEKCHLESAHQQPARTNKHAGCQQL